MSVRMNMRVPGDTDAFRKFVETKGDMLAQVGEAAKGAGCIHHAFAVGDGYIMVSDEWESAEAFQAFFDGNKEIAQIMQEGGAQGPPEISIGEAIETPDSF